VGEANGGGKRHSAARGGTDGSLPDTTRRSPSPNLPEEEPPFGGSWRALYTGVLGTLVTLILLFYVFTKVFE
jgi:hypothetical protein